jgi:hypothetical protein
MTYKYITREKCRILSDLLKNMLLAMIKVAVPARRKTINNHSDDICYNTNDQLTVRILAKKHLSIKLLFNTIFTPFKAHS